ncbi:heme NO-binding domain-containing protein [Abyssibacter profundi]|uniref:Heme NO-binding domain-containing protein n=1 Tax=Abyssibacter profundi TaxID=2182787 RepID=A0A363ULP8_9GAMM|nr:heme NO-binding domain-containing protein [Abyssibacter profundi]MBV62010.1 hypothetical protein [Nevskiales bacterium]PWN56332.1 hypothetical protein DEH80_08710 [Abyssibacter profundi]
MKGVVFTELVEMVESVFSPDIADQMIENANLPSGGAYTAVGTYDHAEIVSLVVALSELTGMSPEELQQVYGRHLFSRFVVLYPHLVNRFDSGLDLLEDVERVVHAEVLKLYPDAQLPRFQSKRLGPGELEMVYRSPRQMSTLAHGLIEGCLEHFEQVADIERRPQADDAVAFHIRCQS